MKKNTFVCRNMHPVENPLVIDNMCPAGLIAILRGFYDGKENRMTAVLHKHDKPAANGTFVRTLQELVHFLQTDYANGLLAAPDKMATVCNSFSEACIGNTGKHKVYGFATHTRDYFFFIKCTPEIQSSPFAIYCYSRATLIAGGVAQDDNAI